MFHTVKLKAVNFQFTFLFFLVCLYLGSTYPGLLPKKTGAIISAGTNYQEQLFHPLLVNKFYQLNAGQLLWFSANEYSNSLRRQLLSVIDSSFKYGLIKQQYHYSEIKKWIDTASADSVNLNKTEKIFTDAAIAVFKDIYQGYALKPGIGSDPVSSKFADQDNEYLLSLLLSVSYTNQLLTIPGLLEPNKKEYQQLKEELNLQLGKKDNTKAQQLINSMNYFRWIHHFRLNNFIVINIPSAYLRYYEQDSMVLFMKTVLGKPSTPTPRFTAYFNDVILYPYWYPPASIIFNELLPKIKKNPSIIDSWNMQVVDRNGKILNHHKLNWASFHAGYFPYILRQSTGCDNSLGIIKFNITSPYGVYLHDTNNKIAFLSGWRFYSHGCIRIEEPIKLGNHILHERLDTTFLQSCFKEQKPIPVLLDNPIPVFVVYMMAEADPAGKIRYYPDIYKLLK
jgi:L,D-transpeptidase YcbB